jgi:dihydroxyacid dehydratase/phosphogluconate dehydratase
LINLEKFFCFVHDSMFLMNHKRSQRKSAKAQRTILCHNLSLMDLKHRSHGITDGRDQAPARAMFKAIGFTDSDLAKPIIGVANTWIETMPCNFHLRRLSAKVKEGIRAAGGTPMEFNTIAISDGETMGTEGMRASLVSRELIADSIELVCRGQMFDAVVCVVGCDKTIPAGAMALARLNIPGLVLYGGTIAPGSYRGKDVTIQDVFEAVGANAAGKMTDAELHELENVACPAAGACGGQYTANTMSTVMEMIGLSPMGFNSVPAMDPKKDQIAYDCGELVLNLLRKGITPKDILTRPAFENAIASVAATGGSTNAVLHLLAMAREADVPLQIDDFQRVSERTPLLADLKPSGRFVATDMHAPRRRRASFAKPPAASRPYPRVSTDRLGADFVRRRQECGRNSRSGSDCAAGQAAEENWRPGDSAWQSRARGMCRQDQWPRTPESSWAGAGLRI